MCLATMFVFTAASHFIPRTRNELVRMVRPRLPVPGVLGAATGVLELAGAVGLLLSGVVRIALALPGPQANIRRI